MSGESRADVRMEGVGVPRSARIHVDCWAVARAGDFAAAIAINTVSYVEGLLAMPLDVA